MTLLRHLKAVQRPKGKHTKSKLGSRYARLLRYANSLVAPHHSRKETTADPFRISRHAGDWSFVPSLAEAY